MEIRHFRLSLGLSSHLLLRQRKPRHRSECLRFKSERICRKKERKFEWRSVQFASEAPLVLKFTESCHGGVSVDIWCSTVDTCGAPAWSWHVVSAKWKPPHAAAAALLPGRNPNHSPASWGVTEATVLLAGPLVWDCGCRSGPTHLCKSLATKNTKTRYGSRPSTTCGV